MASLLCWTLAESLEAHRYSLKAGWVRDPFREVAQAVSEEGEEWALCLNTHLPLVGTCVGLATTLRRPRAWASTSVGGATWSLRSHPSCSGMPGTTRTTSAAPIAGTCNRNWWRVGWDSLPGNDGAGECGAGKKWMGLKGTTAGNPFLQSSVEGGCA